MAGVVTALLLRAGAVGVLLPFDGDGGEVLLLVLMWPLFMSLSWLFIWGSVADMGEPAMGERAVPP